MTRLQHWMRSHYWQFWSLYILAIYWGLVSYRHLWNRLVWQRAALSSFEIIPELAIVAACSWFFWARADQPESSSRTASAIIWTLATPIILIVAITLLLMLFPAFSVLWYWIHG